MMSTDYIAERYITIDDALDNLGFTKPQQESMPQIEKNRYQDWVKESNNKIEIALSEFTDVLPLKAGSQEMTFAKSAALNWLIYKKRDLAGSKNATNAKGDYDRDILDIKTLLRKRPTDKQFPIGVKRSDSLQDYAIPYSQTSGWPPDLLY